MKINNVINRIDELLQEGVNERIFSGAAAGVAAGKPETRGRLMRTAGATRYEAGVAVDDRTVFDLASLTKPLATTLLLLALAKRGVIDPEQPLALFFPEARADKASITLRQLLSHSSGLPAHRPYHLQLAGVAAAERLATLARLVLAEPLEYAPGSRAQYSDLGFLLLGRIIEKAGGAPLDRLFAEWIATPLGLEDELFFNRTGQMRPRSYAATEFCPWRGRVLVGEVSDENCHVLGGVAGHAGLFGTIGGVLALVETIHDCWQGWADHPALDRDQLSLFLTRQPTPGSTWALGFDTPSPLQSSAGHFFSPASVGHLGFTGTSFWLDPARHLCVVLLTNRVHPSRENHAIKAFRPRFHDLFATADQRCSG